MIINEHKIAGFRKPVTVCEYTSVNDFIKQAKRGRYLSGQGVSSNWEGGTFDHMERGLRGRVPDFIDNGKSKMGEYTNVAVQNYAVDFDYNPTYGVLDYGAAVAGNPAYMYGATVMETDRSPIHIYIDTWVSGDVSPKTIEKRGIGILALIQTLSLFRPVNTYIAKGSEYTPKKADTIQLLQIPTSPMDLSRASFMLCSPTINRQGLLNSIYAVHNYHKHCPSYPMSDRRWQKHSLPKWVAEQQGVTDYIHMTGMFESNFWNSDVRVIEWIKKHVQKYVKLNEEQYV